MDIYGFPDPHFVPAKQQLREYDAKITILVIFFVDLLIVGALIGVLLCPSYHFTTLVFVTGALINFDVGLWTVRTTGNPQGWFGKFNLKLISQFINTITSRLNDKSLTEFQVFACYVDSIFLQLIPTGCSTVITLRIASYILASCLILATILVFLGALSLLVFWYSRRTVMSWRLTFFLHVVPGCIVIIGVTLYLLVGGTNLNFGVNVPGLVADVNPVDLGFGFFVSTGIGILCLIVPAFMYFLLPEKLCDDSRDQYELEESYEDEALLRALNQERQQLNTLYNNPALPVNTSYHTPLYYHHF